METSRDDGGLEWHADGIIQNEFDLDDEEECPATPPDDRPGALAGFSHGIT